MKIKHNPVLLLLLCLTFTSLISSQLSIIVAENMDSYSSFSDIKESMELRKLYTIPAECGSYMASFIRDEYVVFSSFHMDISWDRTLISSAGDLCILKAKTGELLHKVKPGTYKFDPENGELYQIEVPFNPLIFSLDSKIGVHDPYHGFRGAYEFETGKVRLIDKESVPGGLSNSLYPGQVSYDGSIIAVGEGPTGRLVVFEWDGEKYRYLWSSPRLGDIRRIQMSVDGKLIYVGSLTSDLYAFERKGNEYVERFRVKMDGVGALGLAEPWNPTYLWGGSADGEAFVVNATSGDVISREKFANNRGYNPFYDRMGVSLKELRLLPIKFLNGPGVVYDLFTGKWITYTDSELGGGSAASTSETNKFIALGRTVFEVLTKQKVLKLLVVGTCYADENLDECRDELLPFIDHGREDSPISRAVRHLEKEALGVYRIEIYPSEPLVIQLPDSSEKYPDEDAKTLWYDPPISPISGKYRYDTENRLKALGYNLGDYNAILAVQTDKVIRTFNLIGFRAATVAPWLFRKWGFAAVSIIQEISKTGNWENIFLTSWAVYAHELGHALFSLHDYYEGSPDSRGKLYGWSLMGDHDGWNAELRLLKIDEDSKRRIWYVQTDGALLDIYNKRQIKVVKESYPILGDAELDLTPTEEIIAGSLAYVIKGANHKTAFSTFSRNYSIEARTNSIKQSFRSEQGIEGGIIVYTEDSYKLFDLPPTIYVQYMPNAKFYDRFDAPSLFLSEDPRTSVLVDPTGFRIFKLIGDMDESPDRFRPRVEVAWCNSNCKNLRGIVVTASLPTEAAEGTIYLSLNHTLKLYGITKDGRLIGFDPMTDQYWLNISGAYASGPGFQQWVFVPKDLDINFFIRYQKNNPSIPSIPIIVNATWIEYGEAPQPRIVIGRVEIADSEVKTDDPRRLSPGETVIVKPGETIVLEGDINGDGVVNHVDLAILAKHYGSSFNQPTYIIPADLNIDGAINYVDLAILAKNYGREYA